MTVLGTQGVALGCHIQPFQGSEHDRREPLSLQSAEEIRGVKRQGLLRTRCVHQAATSVSKKLCQQQLFRTDRGLLLLYSLRNPG